MSDVTGLVEHFHYIGLFILLVLGGIGFPFPEGATLILCGFLISTHVIKIIPTLLITYSGVLIGDSLFYYIGRKYGRMIVTHEKFRKIISTERLSDLENKFNKWGTLFILIGGRLIGEVFLVAGIMKMPLPKFLIIDAISSLITVGLWGSIGYAGGHSFQLIKKDISRIEHMITFIIIILLVIYLFLRYFKSRNRRMKS